MQKIVDEIIDFIRKKSGGKGLILGLSGGIDSALVAYLVDRANIPLRAYALPSSASSTTNLQDAKTLAQKLKLNFEVMDISDFLKLYMEKFYVNDLSMGNFTTRIRMAILYDLSAKYDSLVIGTSNKTERYLGYGTVYGDLACAFNPIGNLYKSQIYDLASFLNIDRCFIDKPPSADLFAEQTDEREIGFKYKDMDLMLGDLEHLGYLVGQNLSNDDFVYYCEVLSTEHDEIMVKSILNRIKNNVFKSHMPEILKI